MKKLSLVITIALTGLSFTAFSQSSVTSYQTNDLNRLGNSSVYIGTSAGFNSTGALNTVTGAFSAVRNTSGSNNTFTGYATGLSNTTGSNNIFTGAFSGYSNTTGSNNIFTGFNAGYFNTTGIGNIFTGFEAGYSNTTGFSNVFIGDSAGRSNTTGGQNIFTGPNAGQNNTDGNQNIFTGFQSGENNISGDNNIFTGFQSGNQNTTGIENVIMGTRAGRNNNGDFNVFIGSSAGNTNISGSNTIAIGSFAGFRSGFNEGGGENNVFIGHYAGFNERGNNKLYIDDSDNEDLTDADTPLIYGDFETNQLVFHGQVSTGIGNTNFPTNLGGEDISDYTLFVQGGLLTEQLRVNTNWADYVFEDTYELKSLSEVEVFINENGHLPNVPSAKQVEASGINVGEITKIQQEKIEELTLYLIEISKEVKAIKQENVELKQTLVKLQK